MINYSGVGTKANCYMKGQIWLTVAVLFYVYTSRAKVAVTVTIMAIFWHKRRPVWVTVNKLTIISAIIVFWEVGITVQLYSSNSQL